MVTAGETRPFLDDEDVVRGVLASRVLIVDADPASAVQLAHLVQEAGFAQVEGVTGVPEALRRMRSWQPDLVLIDLAAPSRERSTLLADLRDSQPGDSQPRDSQPGDSQPGDSQLRDPPLRDPAQQAPPVILAMTADACADSGPDALRAGAADIVRKPFRDEELVQRVRNLLAVRVLARRWREQSAQLEGLVAERLRDLEQQRRFLHAVLDGLEDGIVACDADGRVALANVAATRLGLGRRMGPRCRR